MSNRLIKVALSIIIFLSAILTVGQSFAATDRNGLTEAANYDVRLTTDGSWGSYPFHITAEKNNRKYDIFCNQHGAALSNGSYSFTPDNWGQGKWAAWTSINDPMGFVFANYADNEVQKKYGYDEIQKTIWNIDRINSKVEEIVQQWEEDRYGENRDWKQSGKTYVGDNSWTKEGNVERRGQNGDSIKTIESNSNKDESAVAKIINDTSTYIKLCKYIEHNDGKYPVTLELLQNDPVFVNTTERTYIIGNFVIDYEVYDTSIGELTGITDIEVIDVETGNPISDAMLQKEEDGGIYPTGVLPKRGEKFNVIIPYNNGTRNTKQIKLVVKYKYLKSAWADVYTWRLSGDVNEWLPSYTDENGKTHYDWFPNEVSKWQKQMSIGEGKFEWETDETEIQPQLSPWTFELQKVGQQDGRELSNVNFEITFYDQNGKVEKDTQVYQTNSRGIIQIPGLDFYGDLKVKIKEISTVRGYALDSTEKWINFHKENGPTKQFESIYFNPDEIREVNGRDGMTLTAVIENAKEGFNLDIIKIASSSKDYDNELSGAKFNISLDKVEWGKNVTVYKATGKKSPVVSVTEEDIREYLSEKKSNYNYKMEGTYVAHITETTVPNGYKDTLKNKEITVEFDVSKRFLPSRYEIENVNIEIDGKKETNTNKVDCKDVSDSGAASLEVYVKNEGYIPNPPPSRKSYTLNLEKYAVNDKVDIKNPSNYSPYVATFNVTLYQLENGSKKQIGSYENKSTTNGKLSLSGLRHTGDILVKIEETDSKSAKIIGDGTKYVRYNATKQGRYYYINDSYHADENGNKVKNNDDLKIYEDGISLTKAGSSSTPELTMGILNIIGTIDLTMDIKGTVFLDAATGKAGQIDGLYDGADDPMEGIEVNLYEVIDEKTITPIKMVRTNSEGQYEFTELNAMKKYVVKFTYNGQDYTNTKYFADNENAYNEAATNAYNSVEKWEQYSKAKEDLLFNQTGDITRETLNNRFATISEYPNSYERTTDTGANAGIYNAAYSDDVMKEVYQDILEAIHQGNTTSEQIETYLRNQNKISDIDKKLTYAKDCEIVAYTDQYPAMSKFHISNKDGKMYSVDLTTNPPTRKPDNKENYPALYEGQNQINFGLVRRADVDLALSEDVLKTEVSLNGKTTTYDYNKWLADGQASKVGFYANDIASEDMNNNYKQNIRTDDIQYPDAYAGKTNDLTVDVYYKIQITNQSDIYAGVTEVVDYFDANFYNNDFVEAYWNDTLLTTTLGDIINGADGNRYRKVYIDLSNTTPEGKKKPKSLLKGDSEVKDQYIYVHVKYTHQAPQGEKTLYDILDYDNLRTRNYTEINEYQTYTNSNMETTPGLVDKDSIAGNFNVAQYEADSKNYRTEDDESRAPELFYKLPDENNIRTLSGNVFEDLRANLSTGEVNKEKLDEKELRDKLDSKELPGITGITVEFIEIENDGQERVRYVTETDESGNYYFTNYIPGNYVIRFTYGDKVYTVVGNDNVNETSKTYGAQEYQSTYANPYTNTNEAGKDVRYWYAEYDENGNAVMKSDVGVNNPVRFSDASDKVQDRKAAIDYTYQTNKNLNNETVVALKQYSANDFTQLSNEDKEALTKAMTMQAYTSTLELEVEFATEKTMGNQTPQPYAVENIDFGLIKRAESNLELEKHISHIKITQSDGTILLNSDVEKQNNKLVLTNSADATSNRVHFQSIPTPNAYGTQAAKLEIDNEILHGNNIEITYTLQVRNTTPRKTSLTWYKDGNDEVAVGYYEEEGNPLITQSVYYENGAIQYHNQNRVDSRGYTDRSYEIVKTKANQVVDYVSTNLTFDSTKTEDNALWKQIENKHEELYKPYHIPSGIQDSIDEYHQVLLATENNPLITKMLEPGEATDTTSLTLSTTTTEDTDLDYTNVVEIIKLENTAGRVDNVSTPGNLNPVTAKIVDFDRKSDGYIHYTDEDMTTDYRKNVELERRNPNTGISNPEYKTTTTDRADIYEPDSAKAEYVVITDSTGDTHYPYVLIGSMLAIFTVGIVGIKKFVLTKRIK